VCLCHGVFLWVRKGNGMGGGGTGVGDNTYVEVVEVRCIVS